MYIVGLIPKNYYNSGSQDQSWARQGIISQRISSSNVCGPLFVGNDRGKRLGEDRGTWHEDMGSWQEDRDVNFRHIRG